MDTNNSINPIKAFKKIVFFFRDILNLLDNKYNDFILLNNIPTDNSYLWWLKTYLYIFLPLFLMYLYFKKDWLFKLRRRSPFTKFELYVQMEASSILMWIWFLLTMGLINRWTLTYWGNWDLWHQHNYIFHHHGEEYYDKWAELQHRLEIKTDIHHRYGLLCIKIHSWHESLQYIATKNFVSTADFMLWTQLWNGCFIIVNDPKQELLAWNSTQANSYYQPKEQFYCMLHKNSQWYHTYMHKYLGGRKINWIYVEYKRVFDLLHTNLDYSSQTNKLPIAHVIESQRYYEEYCYQNNLKINYATYYWVYFFKSLKNTWIDGIVNLYWKGSSIFRFDKYYNWYSLWQCDYFLIEDFFVIEYFFFFFGGYNNSWHDVVLSFNYKDFYFLITEGISSVTDDWFSRFILDFLNIFK